MGDSQRSALALRNEYELVIDSNSNEGTISVQPENPEDQDKDLRESDMPNTPREHPLDMIIFSLSVTASWSEPCPAVLFLSVGESKAIKRLRACLAILVQILCALLSSVTVAVCQRYTEGRREFQTSGGELSLKTDAESRLTMKKTKTYFTHNQCDQCDPVADKKNVICYSKRKPAISDLKDSSQEKTLKEILDLGENSMKRKPGRGTGLFDHLQPAAVSGVVYPVNRQRPEAGRGPQPQGQLSPQSVSPADRQWPADSMEDTPWITFRQELYRLGTFLNLPREFPVSPLRLAQAGFLRLADSSIVCFFCGLVRNEWSRQDVPMKVHKDLRPDCPLVTGVNCDNLSVGDSQPAEQLAQIMQRMTLQQGLGAIHRPGMTDFPASVSRNGYSSETGAQAYGGSVTASHIPSPAFTGQPPQQQRRLPCMGLLGGAPSEASPSRPPVLDGTAQPEPRGSTPQSQGGVQVVTYSQLGIVTGNPRRPDMATVDSRLATFRGRSEALLPANFQLVEAGFYYAGYSDCARCFFCAGGLKNWEPTDDPWVAHARWFSACAYVRQCQGQVFIDVVRELISENHRQSMSMDQVRREMARRYPGTDQRPDLSTDPAVCSAVSAGYDQRLAEQAARRMLIEGHQLSALRLMDYLEEDGTQPPPADDSDVPESSANATAELDSLQTENTDLRQRSQCKVCLDQDASIIFLPCGHMATCVSCSPALSTCPLCRLTIKGRVRAFWV